MADVLFTRRADDRVSNNDQLAPLVIDHTASFVSPDTRSLQVVDIVYMNAVGCYSDHGDSLHQASHATVSYPHCGVRSAQPEDIVENKTVAAYRQ